LLLLLLLLNLIYNLDLLDFKRLLLLLLLNGWLEPTSNKSDIEQKSENTIEKVEISTQSAEEEIAQSKQEIDLPIINIKKSDDEAHQFIESIDTKHHANDLLQFPSEPLLIAQIQSTNGLNSSLSCFISIILLITGIIILG
jgi:hypothetical protein